MSTRPRALITGASSGIGAALARTLAERGYDLVLLARRRDRLDQVASEVSRFGATAEVLAVDLATPAGLDAATTRAAAGDLRLLVANAGAAGYARLSDVTADDLDSLWRLNATAPISLAHAALPALLSTGNGGIATVASMLAFSSGINAPGMPARTLYAAAKSATVAFTRTLAGELAGTGVSATVICPPRVAPSGTAAPTKASPTHVRRGRRTGLRDRHRTRGNPMPPGTDRARSTRPIPNSRARAARGREPSGTGRALPVPEH